MEPSSVQTVRILGTRGVPAAHGGFETFAEHLAEYLVARNWRVVVYCQESGDGPLYYDNWNGIERVHIPVTTPGPRGTMVFDWQATRHAARSGGICLTLGYNTAIFSLLLKLRGVFNVINMDGIEWRRAKWGRIAKIWFWINDWAGCLLANHLVADHPEIEKHLRSRARSSKITTIPYGAERIVAATPEPLTLLGLRPQQYLSLIARPEPENTILEIVQGFSRRRRGVELVVLGTYDDNRDYHRAVRAAASKEVRFVGAIYDKEVLRSLRFHSLAYVHGHQVGGTNPSLVEALGAGNAIIAHDNRFNRWVAGQGAAYFSDADDFDKTVGELLHHRERLAAMQRASIARFEDGFKWPVILAQYERVLSASCAGAR